ncbi:MAG: tetratricopeptide repeat protein [candidate division Zixibacteria bacterium]|nr:tetratricopeptide repeat protein [candidate division Zixibacteria bacterium]
MKNITKHILLATLIVAVVAVSISHGRKLPVGTYISSVKIEIISGEVERYNLAIAYLDSLAMHYGPHAEALNLRAQIEVDLIEKTSSPQEKAPHVEIMVAYFDSLKACCDNKEIKKKYRKNCDKYVQTADSIKVKYWREFYNAGIEQLGVVKDAIEERDLESDSASIAFMNESIEANTDSCIANMKISIIIDNTDYRSFVAVGSVYAQKNDVVASTEWLSKGLEKTDDRASLLLQIAYNHINLTDYEAAIPFLKEYVELTPDDIVNMSNLAACYNNTKQYDAAAETYKQVIAADPTNANALVNIGQYFNQMASNASAQASKTEEETAKTEILAQKESHFDSSVVYFKLAVEAQPENADAVEQYAVISALREDYAAAAEGFEKLVVLKPGNPDFFASLGDCYLYQKNYKKSAEAYEKVVEIEPTNLPIWQNLQDLYLETKEPEKQKAAAAKVKELSK